MSISIKVSELTVLNQITNDDYIVINDSGSTTTMRATFDTLSSWVLAQNCDSSSWASSSLSASYAKSSSYSNNSTSSSYSLSSSYGLSSSYAYTVGNIPSTTLIDTASYSKTSSVSLSASYAKSASYSLSSSYGLSCSYAKNSSLNGVKNSFPYWNASTDNGGLNTYSSLYITRSNHIVNDQVLSVGINSIETDVVVLDAINRPDFKWFSYFRPEQNSENGNNQDGYGGIMSMWPIVSRNFIGTDQCTWKYAASTVLDDITGYTPPLLRTFWSGSSINTTINGITNPLSINGSTGAISNEFNKKWIRLSAFSLNQYKPGVLPTIISDNSSYGEKNNSTHGLFGRIRIGVVTGANFSTIDNTKNRSDVNQFIDMDVHCQQYGGGISVNVLVGSIYGNTLTQTIIKKLRISQMVKLPSDPYTDPMFALDIFVDDIDPYDDLFNITAQSWGGVIFLSTPNVGVPELELSNILIIPPTSGHYTTLGQYQDHYIQGANVVITPNKNEITESVALTKSPYSLHVSGTINTQNYYSNGNRGQSGNFVVYDPITGGWFNMKMNGGILIDSSSAAAPSTGITVTHQILPNPITKIYASNPTVGTTVVKIDPSLFKNTIAANQLPVYIYLIGSGGTHYLPPQNNSFPFNGTGAGALVRLYLTPDEIQNIPNGYFLHANLMNPVNWGDHPKTYIRVGVNNDESNPNYLHGASAESGWVEYHNLGIGLGGIPTYDSITYPNDIGVNGGTTGLPTGDGFLNTQQPDNLFTVNGIITSYSKGGSVGTIENDNILGDSFFGLGGYELHPISKIQMGINGANYGGGVGLKTTALPGFNTFRTNVYGTAVNSAVIIKYYPV